jgi:hypothetical protein
VNPPGDQPSWWAAAKQAMQREEPTWLAVRRTRFIPEELPGAIARFDAGPSAAGRAAAAWLREEALAFESARTWLLVARGEILGFCSLASSVVALTTRQRAEVASGYRRTPATLVAWLAKGVDAPVEGTTLLLHAAAIGRRVARMQATVVLAVDAFDEPTADLWRERFGFRDSAPPVKGETRPPRSRLWVPLTQYEDQ